MRSLRIIRSLAFYFTKRFLSDKTALFFTFVFPLVFLFIFGGLFGSDNGPSFNVALIDKSDSQFARQFIAETKKTNVLEIEETDDFERAKERLSRGEIDAILELPQTFGAPDASGRPSGKLVTYFDEGDQQLEQALTAVANGLVNGLNQPYINQDVPFAVENRSLKTANLDQFDYTFAGLLGFALVSLGIFGMANGFASDKKVGAYRRMRVAPIKSGHIIVATGIMYTFVGLLTVAAMYLVATLLLGFDMRGNILEFFAFAALGSMCMYGFGIAVAGWAKNENQAAPLANLVAFPMMFLSGAFLPRFLMPDWLQSVTDYVPLTPVIDGIRRIITENAHLWQLGPELAIIAGWTIAIYLLAFKLFRWE